MVGIDKQVFYFTVGLGCFKHLNRTNTYQYLPLISPDKVNIGGQQGLVIFLVDTFCRV